MRAALALLLVLALVMAAGAFAARQKEGATANPCAGRNDGDVCLPGSPGMRCVDGSCQDTTSYADYGNIMQASDAFGDLAKYAASSRRLPNLSPNIASYSPPELVRKNLVPMDCKKACDAYDVQKCAGWEWRQGPPRRCILQLGPKSLWCRISLPHPRPESSTGLPAKNLTACPASTQMVPSAKGFGWYLTPEGLAGVMAGTLKKSDVMYELRAGTPQDCAKARANPPAQAPQAIQGTAFFEQLQYWTWRPPTSAGDKNCQLISQGTWQAFSPLEPNKRAVFCAWKNPRDAKAVSSPTAFAQPCTTKPTPFQKP